MAKELPYFKFEPNQWENGNIQICTHEEKGVFIDLCSMYWSRLGDVSFKLAVQKLCGGNAVALKSLCDNNVIEVIDENIYIKFLSEQLNEFEDTSKKNSKNAKEGWIKRRLSKELSEANATALPTQSDPNAIREDKRREDKIINKIDFDIFWDLYDKKVGEKEKIKKKWNNLNLETQNQILEFIPKYKKAKPDKQFRKDPSTFFNNKSWNDEIIEAAKTPEPFKIVFPR